MDLEPDPDIGEVLAEHRKIAVLTRPRCGCNALGHLQLDQKSHILDRQRQLQDSFNDGRCNIVGEIASHPEIALRPHVRGKQPHRVQREDIAMFYDR